MTHFVAEPGRPEVSRRGPQRHRRRCDRSRRCGRKGLPCLGSHGTPRPRAEILAQDLRADARATPSQLADLITAENGKSGADALAEVTYAAEFFRWFAEEAVRTGGDYGSSPAGGNRTIVTTSRSASPPWSRRGTSRPRWRRARSPRPSPPGCTVVLKPAAETPLTALAIAGAADRAGVPEGVVNVVTTTSPAGVVTTWLEDPRMRKLSFTGSTAVGTPCSAQAADRVVNTRDGARRQRALRRHRGRGPRGAVAGAMIAKFRNGGQACTAANRFYVHADVLDEFVAECSARGGEA